EEDTGGRGGGVRGAKDISFTAMREKMQQFVSIVKQDPAIDNAVVFTGGEGSSNTGRMFITLKPLRERKASADQIINRLRPKLAVIPGATLFLTAQQEFNIGGRFSNPHFQNTQQSEKVDGHPNLPARLVVHTLS